MMPIDSPPNQVNPGVLIDRYEQFPAVDCHLNLMPVAVVVWDLSWPSNPGLNPYTTPCQLRAYNEYMPKRLSIQPHLALNALERCYRAAKYPVGRSHWQMVWLLAQGLPTARRGAGP
jgi:hypothetical protein